MHAITLGVFFYFLSHAGHTSLCDLHAVPRYGERLRDENQHVCRYCRDGQSLGVHRQKGRSHERVQTIPQRDYACQTCENKILQFFYLERSQKQITERRVVSFLQGSDGEFPWDSTSQGYLLSAFFYGYVITQIPFGILAKRYGSKYFLGIGMLINSLFGLLVPVAAYWGYTWLIIVRFIQGLGEASNGSFIIPRNM